MTNLTVRFSITGHSSLSLYPYLPRSLLRQQHHSTAPFVSRISLCLAKMQHEMKYQSTTPIFWFRRQLRGFSSFCKGVIHMHMLNMNMRLTQECHQDIRSFVRHLSKGYTSSINRGGYKFRGATYLIWEPALFLFRYEWQKATDNYSCSGSIRPLQWKTIGTQVYKKTHSFSMSFTQLGGEPAPPQTHGKSTTLMLLRPLAPAMFLLVAPRVQQEFWKYIRIVLALAADLPARGGL